MLTRPFSSNIPAAMDAVVQAWTAGFAAQLAAGGDRVHVRDGQWVAAESGGAWSQDLAVGWYGFYPGYQYPSRSMSEELGESVVSAHNVLSGLGPSQEETFSINCASLVASGGDPVAANWSLARHKAFGNISTAAAMIADPQIGGIYLNNVVQSLTIGADITMHEVAGRRGILVIAVFGLLCVGTSQQ